MLVDNADARTASLRVPDSAGLGWGPGNLRLRTSPGDLAARVPGNTPGTGQPPPPTPTATRRPPALVAPRDPQRHLLILLNSHSDPRTGLPSRPRGAARRPRQSTPGGPALPAGSRPPRRVPWRAGPGAATHCCTPLRPLASQSWPPSPAWPGGRVAGRGVRPTRPARPPSFLPCLPP